MNPVASIIICSRNRAPALEKTLAALRDLSFLPGWDVELIVADNGSTDETRAVVTAASLTNPSIRYLYEPQPGQSRARNTALGASTGELIVFTDDDIIPDVKWLEALTKPLRTRAADATSGRTVLAPHLQRSWMEPQHKLWLAAPDDPAESSVELIGANMAFHRRVLDQVPAFDPELGPGALGFADDTLFSFQLAKAGYKIAFVPEACVVHHLDRIRLLRREWLRASAQRGRTQAYLRHHWYHTEIPMPFLRKLYYRCKLALRRSIQPPPLLEAEGCPRWEISYVANIAMSEQFLLERRRARNYAREGLARTDYSRCESRETASEFLN